MANEGNAEGIEAITGSILRIMPAIDWWIASTNSACFYRSITVLFCNEINLSNNNTRI